MNKRNVIQKEIEDHSHEADRKLLLQALQACRTKGQWSLLANASYTAVGPMSYDTIRSWRPSLFLRDLAGALGQPR